MMGRDYHREYSRKYYHRKRAEYISLLGGKCVKCSSIENLEFDHVDPETKSFDIGELLNRSKARTLEELKKCQLLCQICHKEKSDAYQRLADEKIKLVVADYFTGNFSQRQLAEKYKISQTTVSDYCRIAQGIQGTSKRLNLGCKIVSKSSGYFNHSDKLPDMIHYRNRGYSNRSIAKLLGIDRNTVDKYLKNNGGVDKRSTSVSLKDTSP